VNFQCNYKLTPLWGRGPSDPQPGKFSFVVNFQCNYKLTPLWGRGPSDPQPGKFSFVVNFQCNYKLTPLWGRGPKILIGSMAGRFSFASDLEKIISNKEQGIKNIKQIDNPGDFPP
jgi:hypothetical protein